MYLKNCCEGQIHNGMKMLCKLHCKAPYRYKLLFGFCIVIVSCMEKGMIASTEIVSVINLFPILMYVINLEEKIAKGRSHSNFQVPYLILQKCQEQEGWKRLTYFGLMC